MTIRNSLDRTEFLLDLERDLKSINVEKLSSFELAKQIYSFLEKRDDIYFQDTVDEMIEGAM